MKHEPQDPRSRIRDTLERAIAERAVPAAVAIHGDLERTHVLYADGVHAYPRAEGQLEEDHAAGHPSVSDHTLFDLASLTKVVATLPVLLALLDTGAVRPGDTVRSFFANAGWFQSPSLADATLTELATHTSGLPAWIPLFARTNDPDTALAAVLQTPLEDTRGTVVYSDLGFILLGAILERAGGAPLDRLAHELVFTPLGMTDTRYGPVEPADAAATERCGWRNRLLRGEVHDENAFVLGGVAGHAGLFGSARDLARYAQAWLRRDAPFARPETLDDAVREHVRSSGPMGRRALGWQLHPEPRVNERAYGHTGFTGTSLWIDPERERFSVLLTNRVHPTRHGGDGIVRLRDAVHAHALAPEA